MSLDFSPIGSKLNIRSLRECPLLPPVNILSEKKDVHHNFEALPGAKSRIDFLSPKNQDARVFS